MNEAVPGSTSASEGCREFVSIKEQIAILPEADSAAPERRAEDSLSMTRRILLCQEQTPDVNEVGHLRMCPRFSYHDAAI